MVIRTKAPVSTDVSLENGDHLTRDEFHERYLERPDIKKAELIDGVVFVASPVRFDRHAAPHFAVIGWLAVYVAFNPGAMYGGDNGTVYLDGDVEVQPDAFLWRTEPGGPHLTDDGYIEGAPQLVVEVAGSSVSYDLHNKKEAYRRNGVREYVVWRVQDQAIDWFHLEGGQYVAVQPDGDGLIESAQFPGLKLDVRQMLAGNLAAVLAHLSAPASDDQESGSPS